jgi:hypothetical protein
LPKWDSQLSQITDELISESTAPRSHHTSKKAYRLAKLAERHGPTARRAAAAFIARDILTATQQFEEVIQQIKDQGEALHMSNDMLQERIFIAKQLLVERSLVIQLYTEYLEEQKERLRQLGYSWPYLDDIQDVQSGSPPTHG